MKKTETKEETKKTLSWRLSELPTAGEVAELVDSGVITSEEAREILFKESSSGDEKVKALEEQVEFLQDLVKQLASARGTTFVPFTRVINTPYVYWANTNKALSDSGLSVSRITGTGRGDVTMSVSASGNIS